MTASADAENPRKRPHIGQRPSRGTRSAPADSLPGHADQGEYGRHCAAVGAGVNLQGAGAN